MGVLEFAREHWGMIITLFGAAWAGVQLSMESKFLRKGEMREVDAALEAQERKLAVMDERLAQQATINQKVETLERDFNRLNSTLPLTYVLRDDYIRGQAVLEAKMDAVHKTLSELYKMESVK